MADVNINLNAKNNATAAINGLVRDVNKMVSSVGQKMQALGGGMQNVGKKFMGIGLAGGAAIAGMTKTFAAFDDQMAKVAALSGATGDELQALRDKAKELGSSTKFSASQAAEGMNYLAMAGFNTNQILEGIPATLSLAAAGGLELAEAADIASDVGTMFGLTADEIGRVADVMAATATSANTNVSMMGESFKYFGAQAKMAGQSIEESSAALAILASRGMKASTAGTSLNQMFAQMVAKKDLFDDLKVSISDTNGEMRPMLDVMQDLGEATKDMTQEERLSWFNKLGVRAGRAAAMLAGAPKEEIESFRNTMDNAAGSAERMAETMQTGIGGAGVKIMSAFEGMQIEIIEGLKPALLVMADSMIKFFNTVRDYAKENPVAIKAFAALAAGLTALGGVLVTAGMGISAAGVALSGLATIAGTVGTIVGGALSFILSPLGLVTAGIVYAVYASGAWKDLFVSLKKIFQDTLATAKQAFDGLRNAMAVGDAGMALKIAFAGIKVIVTNALAEMYRVAGIMLPKMWELFKSVFQKIAELASNVMKTVIDAIKNPTKALEAYDKLKALFKSDKGFGQLGQEFLDGLADSAKDEFDKLTIEADMKARFGKMGKDVGKGIADGLAEQTEAGSGTPGAVQDIAGMAAAAGLGNLPEGLLGGGAMPAAPDNSGALEELSKTSNDIQSRMEGFMKKIEENTRSGMQHAQDKFEFDVNESIGPGGA